jgi:hypothetical protein
MDWVDCGEDRPGWAADNIRLSAAPTAPVKVKLAGNDSSRFVTPKAHIISAAAASSSTRGRGSAKLISLGQKRKRSVELDATVAELQRQRLNAGGKTSKGQTPVKTIRKRIYEKTRYQSLTPSKHDWKNRQRQERWKLLSPTKKLAQLHPEKERWKVRASLMNQLRRSHWKLLSPTKKWARREKDRQRADEINRKWQERYKRKAAHIAKRRCLAESRQPEARQTENRQFYIQHSDEIKAKMDNMYYERKKRSDSKKLGQQHGRKRRNVRVYRDMPTAGFDMEEESSNNESESGEDDEDGDGTKFRVGSKRWRVDQAMKRRVLGVYKLTKSFCQHNYPTKKVFTLAQKV